MNPGMHDRLLYRCVRLIVRGRWLLLTLGAVVAVGAFVVSRNLEFDRSIENMFADDDPLLAPYRQLKRTFGGNEIVVAAYVDPELMTPRGVRRVAELTAALRHVDGVAAVVSLTTPPLGLRIAEETPLAKRFLTLLEDYAVSADRTTAAVACMLHEEHNSEARDATIRQMRHVVLEHDPSGVLAGEPVMVVDGFAAIREDGRRLGWISTVLLLLTILICFRSPRWVVLSLAVVNLALLITEALLVLSGLRLSMVSSMLWAIITVIGIATVVHVTVHFREIRLRGVPPADALVGALTELSVPFLWTVTTDAVGFASLLAASVGPVQDFGLMMTCGALMVPVGLALVLPGLALAGRFDVDPKAAWGEAALGAGLGRLLDGVLRRPLTVGAIIGVVAAVAAAGSWFVEVETDFTKNFRQSSSIVRAYEMVEDNLRGAGVWDIVAPAPAELNHPYLERLRSLQRQLRDDEIAGKGIIKSLSMADMLDAVPDDPKQWTALLPRPGDHLEGESKTVTMADLGVTPAMLFRLTFGKPTPDELTRVKLSAMRVLMPEVYQTLYGVDPASGRHFARIMLRSRERQPSRDKQRLIARVTEISREHFPGGDVGRISNPSESSDVSSVGRIGNPSYEDEPPAQVTGYFVLLANLINSMVRDQWVTFGIATGVIWVMLAVAYRSPLLACVAMVPNQLPIMVVMGLMGWLGLRLNMGAAMIAAVSMGLAVDSSIHYVVEYQRRRRAGQSHADALHGVQNNVGRAVTLSTLALVVGFSALAFSEFVPIIYFGVLVSLSMLGGMVSNLVVLPLLLHLLMRNKGAPGGV